MHKYFFTFFQQKKNSVKGFQIIFNDFNEICYFKKYLTNG